MNVCVLVGNGFDLALGLKTGYRSFIAEYINEHRESQGADIKWLCETIEKDLETWGDAEIAFGKLPFELARKNPTETYMSCEEDFSVSFQKYLRRENKLFVVPEHEQESTRKLILRSLLELPKWMTTGHRAKCRLVNPKDVSVDFINFNYTDTLKQIVGVDLPISQKIDSPLSEVTMHSVCHVHGTLDDGVLFGVDSPEQIVNQSVRGYCSRTGETIKPRGAEVAGYAARAAGVELLRAADVIVTFGLSFGASDKSWWQLLWERVFDGGRHSQLIVCPYSLQRPVEILGNRMVRNYALEKKRVFHSFAGVNEIASLEGTTADRIIVLQPMQDDQNPYDYFHLTELSHKYSSNVVLTSGGESHE